jgi:hypothetical protein
MRVFRYGLHLSSLVSIISDICSVSREALSDVWRNGADKMKQNYGAFVYILNTFELETCAENINQCIKDNRSVLYLPSTR